MMKELYKRISHAMGEFYANPWQTDDMIQFVANQAKCTRKDVLRYVEEERQRVVARSQGGKDDE